jgi:hypothetical protein
MLVFESNSFVYIYSVVDDGGNTWTPVVTWGGGGVEVWYVADAAATSSITIGYGWGDAGVVSVQEFSGMAGAKVDNKTWTSSLSTTIRTSRFGTSSDDLCIGAVGGQEESQLPVMTAVPGFHNSPQFGSHSAPTDYVSLIAGMRESGPMTALFYGANYPSAQFAMADLVCFQAAA